MNISPKFLSGCAGLGLGLMLACGGGHTQPPTITDVYVAGYEFNRNVNVAKYWKNGVPVSLTDGTHNAIAFAIQVVGNDVYVAGAESNETADVAKYWKNSVAVNLSDGTRQAVAEAIVISAGDVYAAGYEVNAGIPLAIPKYWKNGVAVPLSDGSQGTGEATSIAVSGSDVYVAGWMYETTMVSPNNYVSVPVAKVWKNGVSADFTNPTVTSVATSICLAGSDTRVAGFDASGNSVGGGNYYVAKYWKNGTPVVLTDGTHGAKLFSIATSGADVYTAGFEANANGVDVAKFWKNGVSTTLTDGSKTALVLSLAVLGSDIFTTGFEGNEAVMWENNRPIPLTKGAQDAEGKSIFVVRY